ncbi:MAG: DMT family transporter [Alphaproteobacteria bacterium]
MITRNVAAPSGQPQGAGHLLGIGFVCLAYMMFASLDATAKFLVVTLAPMQIVGMRFLVHAVLSAIMLKPWLDPARFIPKRPMMQIARAFCLIGATMCNFFALRYLQLAETMAIFFLGPFIITALAGPLLNEWAGKRRWTAIAVAFVGALILLQPGPAGFQPAMILSFGSAVSYSLFILLTRKLAFIETAENQNFFSGTFAAIVTLPLCLMSWQPVPDARHWFLLLLTGVIGVVGHWFFIRAHERATVPTLAPFVYSQIVWMVGLGFLVFGDLPRTTTWIGVAIIVGSGLYLVNRERQLARQGAD